MARRIEAGEKPNVLDLRVDNTSFEPTTLFTKKEFEGTKGEVLNEWKFSIFRQMGYEFIGASSWEEREQITREEREKRPSAEFLYGKNAFSPHGVESANIYAIYVRK